MKLRVIVMNGQRIVEIEEDAVWKIQEVGKAGKLRPGIYNLYSSQQVDKSCPFGKPAYHEGTIAGKVRWGSWCWISLNKRER